MTKATQKSLGETRTLLLGGSWSSGKSTTAIRLACDLGIANVIHTDIVRASLRASLLGEDREVVSLATYESWRCAGAQCNAETLARGFLRQCELVWPSVAQCLHEAQDFGKDTIVEGLHLHPALYARAAGRVCLPLVWLHYPEGKYEYLLRRRCQTSYKRRSAARYLESSRQHHILLLNKILLAEARVHDVDTIDTTAEDVVARLRALMCQGRAGGSD